MSLKKHSSESVLLKEEDPKLKTFLTKTSNLINMRQWGQGALD